ncbi:MAG TPA: Gfo/Idh/MocA family oxidoreductase [Chloroflexota bacterium]
MASDVLRVGLIGAGRRGSQHAATLTELTEDFELVAVCDPNPAAVQQHVERYGGHGYGSAHELFASEQLDFVVIATPPDLHHVGVAAAAQHRVNVLVETAMGLTRGMMDVLAETAERAGIVVEVAENYGRRPVELLNRRAVEAGAIGDLVHLSAFNGPANNESAYHIVSLFRAYAGGADVVDVEAIERGTRLDPAFAVPNSGKGETWMDAALTFDNGLIANINYVTTWTSPHRGGRPRIFTVNGTKGHIVSEEAGGTNRLHQVLDGRPRDLAMTVETQMIGGQEVPANFAYALEPRLVETNHFSEWIRTDSNAGTPCDGVGRATELLSLKQAIVSGKPVGRTIADGRRSQEIGISIIEAARTRERMSATLGPETPWERTQHEAFRRRYGVDPLTGFRELI